MKNLKETCDKVIKGSYMMPFTNDELSGFKEQLASLSIEILRKQEEKKKFIEAYKVELKPMTFNRDQALKSLRDGSREVDGELYVFFDQEEGMASIYNQDGEMVSKRKLFPDERQLTIYNEMRKTGTDK
jgi:hypothetical protein